MSNRHSLGDSGGTGRSETSLRAEVAATAGFLALAGALVAGHTTPARGYELSIYTATPTLFWAGVGLATVVGLWLSLSAHLARGIRALGCLLVGGSAVSVGALPVIRGYHFFGPADALTHLGWTKDIFTGRMGSYDILYPSLHTMSVLVYRLTGFSIEYSVELVVVFFLAVYLVFLPLVVWYVVRGWWAVPVGILAAALLVPINNISVFRMAHPATLTVLLSPLVVYLLLAHLDSSGEDVIGWFDGFPTGTDVLIVTAGAVSVFLHPQIALSLLGVLVAMSLVQVVARVRWPRSEVAGHRLLVGHSMVVGAAFLLWAPNHERTQEASSAILQSFVDFFTGRTTPADSTVSQGASLSEIGGQIEVLFVKLFGVSVFLTAVAAGVVLLALYRGRGDARPTADTFVTYVAAGLVSLAAGFLVYFVSSVSKQYFRVLALIMVFVTLLAAVGIARAAAVGASRFTGNTPPWYRSPEPSETALFGVRLLFVVLLVASVPNLYRSPYMYQASDQVPEGHVDGFEATFDKIDRDLPVMALRHGGGRYEDAVYGVERARSSGIRGSAVPPPVFNAGNYTERYNESRYLVLTERDLEREFRVFEELRYDRDGLDHLDEPIFDRVISNGQLRTYYVGVPTNESE